MITLYTGEKIRIDQLTYDCILLDGNKKPTKIKKIKRGHFNYYHILYYFDNGTIIDETHEHRFFNYDKGYWEKLKNWKIGDRAIDQNGNLIALTKIQRIDEPAEMFAVWTESHSYYANELLSGDARANLSIIPNGDLTIVKNVFNTVTPDIWFKVMEGKDV